MDVTELLANDKRAVGGFFAEGHCRAAPKDGIVYSRAFSACSALIVINKSTQEVTMFHIFGDSLRNNQLHTLQAISEQPGEKVCLFVYGTHARPLVDTRQKVLNVSGATLLKDMKVEKYSFDLAYDSKQHVLQMSHYKKGGTPKFDPINYADPLGLHHAPAAELTAFEHLGGVLDPKSLSK